MFHASKARSALAAKLRCRKNLDRRVPIGLLRVNSQVKPPRHIPAAEAGLIALLDVVLGPLWVWLAFDEIPSVLTCLGGAIVCAAILLDTLRGDAAAS